MFGVPGDCGNTVRGVDVCAESGLFVGNMHFKPTKMYIISTLAWLETKMEWKL